MRKDTKYMVFQEIRDTGKTKLWEVRNKVSGDLLGQVRWYGPWRQYCFMPKSCTVFSGTCNTEISTFIEEQMAMRRSEDVC